MQQPCKSCFKGQFEIKLRVGLSEGFGDGSWVGSEGGDDVLGGGAVISHRRYKFVRPLCDGGGDLSADCGGRAVSTVAGFFELAKEKPGDCLAAYRPAPLSAQAKEP